MEWNEIVCSNVFIFLPCMIVGNLSEGIVKKREIHIFYGETRRSMGILV